MSGSDELVLSDSLMIVGGLVLLLLFWPVTRLVIRVLHNRRLRRRRAERRVWNDFTRSMLLDRKAIVPPLDSSRTDPSASAAKLCLIEGGESLEETTNPDQDALESGRKAS
jgi:hypothetical protein